MCLAHYQRWQRGKPTDGPINSPKDRPKHCTVTGCRKPVKGHGLCSAHWSRKRRGAALDSPLTRQGPKPCQVVGCMNKSRSSGLCHGHYRRLRQGRPLVAFRPKADIGRVFDRIMFPKSGCWLWTGPVTNSGYGTASAEGSRAKGVHRVMYEWFVGPIPKGLELDHLCRVKNCCRPDHLEPVTRLVNVRRALQAARGKIALA